MRLDFYPSGTSNKINPLSYLVVLVGIFLTTAFLILVKQWISPVSLALLYLLPIGLGASYYGLGPGVFAAFLAFLAFNFFFVDPLYTLSVHRTQDLIGLFVFLGTAFAIGRGFGMARHNLEKAQAGEHEAIWLSEFSSELAGLHDDNAIAQALERKVQETFLAQWVEIILETQPGPNVGSSGGGYIGGHSNAAELQGQGNSYLPRSGRPDLLVPLQTPHGMIGEIRIWRPKSSFNPTEQRLLQTFANQACLAFERTHLAIAENRARVLEESDRLKTSLLSSVSHEFRTPLATIKASVTALRTETDSLDPEASGELLAAIEEETDHLNLLVGNLLDMSRIESGVLQPKRSWNVLSEIVAGVLHRMQSITKRHTMQVDISEDLPLVYVDYLQLEQVFTNLISNSIKFSPDNTEISISAWWQSDHSICVRVKNQGPAVSEEHLEKIFDKFFRVTAAERVSGIGLGLSICKGIIQAHGGRIWAENQPDGFAYFFTLPITWEGDLKQEDTE
jgi:two-component system, OmpR family, sensor histidine kinase KdpD